MCCSFWLRANSSNSCISLRCAARCWLQAASHAKGCMQNIRVSSAREKQVVGRLEAGGAELLSFLTCAAASALLWSSRVTTSWLCWESKVLCCCYTKKNNVTRFTGSSFRKEIRRPGGFWTRKIIQFISKGKKKPPELEWQHWFI